MPLSRDYRTGRRQQQLRCQSGQPGKSKRSGSGHGSSFRELDLDGAEQRWSIFSRNNRKQTDDDPILTDQFLKLTILDLWRRRGIRMVMVGHRRENSSKKDTTPGLLRASVRQKTILDLVVLSLILRQHQSEKYKESENEKKIEFVPSRRRQNEECGSRRLLQ